MSIIKFIKKVQSNKVDVIDHTKKVLEKIKTINKKQHYLTTISEKLAIEQAKNINKKGKLAGLPISVKDCICVKGVESTAGSAVLKGYKPLFNATVIEKVISEGAIIIGKTIQDEFGFGSFSINVGKGFKSPVHPLDNKRVCGGSSGGSAGLTKHMSLPHASIAESTGGSIETPAAFCGVVGMCPTYATVSRYGLIDYANSLDKIGPMAKTVEGAQLLWSVMTGKDDKDSTSIAAKFKKSKLKTVGVIREFVNQADDQVKKSFEKAEKTLLKKGIKVVDVKLPVTTKYAMQAYYILALSEASTNLAKYCGMRYGASEKLQGSFNEYFSKVRSTHFGEEAKRRVLLGTFARMAGYRDHFYIKAAKVRQKIINEYKQQFKNCQVLLSPTMPMLAPKRADVEKLSPLQQYAMDLMTVGPNLAGIPHLSVPIGLQKGLPVGAMVMANHFDEHVMFDAAKIVEK